MIRIKELSKQKKKAPTVFLVQFRIQKGPGNKKKKSERLTQNQNSIKNLEERTTLYVLAHDFHNQVFDPRGTNKRKKRRKN